MRESNLPFRIPNTKKELLKRLSAYYTIAPLRKKPLKQLQAIYVSTIKQKVYNE